ncbi:MAG: D-alanyl-D-alanine carboxypeptidase, partial [Endomicrobiales bacterium]
MIKSQHGKNVKLLIFLLFMVPCQLSAGLFGGSGKSRIEELLHSSAMKATNIGIKVVALSSGKNIIDYNGAHLFIPASTVKILTAYTALKVLSSQYTFHTDIITDAYSDSTTVHNLYIKGYGDPSMSLADINFQALSVAEKIKHISGDVIVDTSFFDALQFGHGWMWDEGIVSWNA